MRDPEPTPSSWALSKNEGRRCEEVQFLLEEVLDLLLDEWVRIFHICGYVHIDMCMAIAHTGPCP